VLAKLGYHVVAPDMRGYNLSEKPEGIENYRIELLLQDVVQLIHFYNKERAVVISHDWGGGIAWSLAMHHPEVVSKLIVINGPHMAKFAKLLMTSLRQICMSWYIAYFQLPYLPEFTFTAAPRATVRAIFKTFKKSDLTREDYEYYASAWVQPRAMTSMLNYYRALTRYPNKSKSKPINLPTLLIWAENDSALSTELAEGLEEKWVPNIQVKKITNCSHWVTHESGKEISAYVTEFLNSSEKKE
jgi:pimeloyl-ACP methyl ester carboxylesterase